MDQTQLNQVVKLSLWKYLGKEETFYVIYLDYKNKTQDKEMQSKDEKTIEQIDLYHNCIAHMNV